MKIDIDALAQEIRRVDGSNSLGAGALAEALMPFLSATPANPAQVTDAAEPFDDKWLGDGDSVHVLPTTTSIGAGGQAVAWRWKWKNNAEMGWQYSDEPGFNNQYHHGRKIEPLYAHPPQLADAREVIAKAIKRHAGLSEWDMEAVYEEADAIVAALAGKES